MKKNVRVNSHTVFLHALFGSLFGKSPSSSPTEKNPHSKHQTMTEPIDEQLTVAGDDVQNVTRAKLRTLSLFICSVFLVSFHSCLVAGTGGASSFWELTQNNSSSSSVIRLCASGVAPLASTGSLPCSSGLSACFPMMINGSQTVVSQSSSLAGSGSIMLSEQRLVVAAFVVFFLLVLPSFSAVYWFADARTRSALERGCLVASFFSGSLALWLALVVTILVVSATFSSIEHNNYSFEWPWVLTLISAVLSFLLLIWAVKRTLLICCVVEPTFPDDSVEQSAEEAATEREKEAEKRKQRKEKKMQRMQQRLAAENKRKEQQQQPQTATEAPSDGDDNADDSAGQQEEGEDAKQEEEYAAADQQNPTTFYSTRNGLGRAMLIVVMIIAFFSASVTSVAWFSAPAWPTTSSNSTPKTNATQIVLSPLLQSVSPESAAAINCFWIDSATSDDEFSSVVRDAIRSVLFKNKNSTRSNDANATSSSCSASLSFAESLSAIHVGMNGSALCCALILAIGAVLGWTACCLAPFACSSLILSLAGVATMAEAWRQCRAHDSGDDSSVAASATAWSLHLGWPVWVEVASAGVWFVSILISLLVQRVPDRV